MRRKITWLSAIFLTAFVAGLVWDLGSSRPTAPAPIAPPTQAPAPSLASSTPPAAAAPEATPRPQVSPDRPALRPLPQPESESAAAQSAIAESLNKLEQDASRDLAVVFDLFNHYREAFGGFPTGEDNASFVNALSGNNPKRLAFIDRSHPAVNQDGELTDRWKTPLFFHLQSSDALEIRSAGPDRQMYSGDDVLFLSPGLRAAMMRAQNTPPENQDGSLFGNL